MRRRRPLVPAALVALGLTALPGASSAGAPDARPLLDRATVGADAFTRAHPSWDGRGVVIAVLDTGVDPSVAGLTALPQGGTKVIDARDFTGEGDVKLARAIPTTDSGQPVLRTPQGVVRGHDRLAPPPAPGEPWRLGFFREVDLQNSAVTDFDRDGRRDGEFAIVAFRRAGDLRAVFVVDTDGDGDVADEQVRESYADAPVTFGFSHPDPRKDLSPVAIAGTVLLEEGKVSLHFDDGGHGTHVAGIAAGFGVEGRAGFDGIAPGARVLSLKIGHGGLSGGATVAGAMKDAIAFAAEWSVVHDTPVVMNLSYGIGAELEGQSDIEIALDEALLGARHLVASVSAGNEGPGVSTVGTPAGARLAWTAGALLTPQSAETLWGARVARPQVFAFSSRGGELDKPDGLTPGVAWSTIPAHASEPIAAGTSMAAPQATGVLALLASAAQAEALPWTAGKLVRALRATARPLPGYGRLDQGAGVVEVGAAWEALRRLRDHASGQVVAGWKVSTEAVTRPGEPVAASYWRAGAYLPEADERVDVEVSALLYGDATDAERRAAFDTFDLDADVPWILLDRRRLALRADATETLRLGLDAKALAGRPGLHVGRVRARADGLEAFSVPVSVVVPQRFEAGARARSFEGQLAPGEIARTFVEVPPGATALVASLETPKGRAGDTWLLPYDPDGRPVAAWEHHATSADDRRAEWVLAGEALTPGVWELVTYASFRNTAGSHWRLGVRFAALEVPDELRYAVAEHGRATTDFTVTQRFDARFRGAVTAQVAAYVREREEASERGATLEVPVTIMEGVDHVRLRLTLEREVYARFTDVAVDLRDASGKAVAQEGFNNRFCTVEAAVTPGAYTLVIVGATTRRDDDRRWTVRLDEIQRRTAPLAWTVSGPDGGADVALYPGVPAALALEASAPLPELPAGFRPALSLTFKARSGETWYSATRALVREGE